MTTIGQVRVPDESDPNANIIWGPAHAVASAPRPFTFMLGLTSRNWPRQGREDGLLPSHILDTALLEPASVTLQDRTHFAVLRDAANEIVYSRSRRDSEGRLLGTSPLASLRNSVATFAKVAYTTTRLQRVRSSSRAQAGVFRDRARKVGSRLLSRLAQS